jgi:hypothetical protein
LLEAGQPNQSTRQRTGGSTRALSVLGESGGREGGESRGQRERTGPPPPRLMRAPWAAWPPALCQGLPHLPRACREGHGWQASVAWLARSRTPG